MCPFVIICSSLRWIPHSHTLPCAAVRQTSMTLTFWLHSKPASISYYCSIVRSLVITMKTPLSRKKLLVYTRSSCDRRCHSSSFSGTHRKYNGPIAPQVISRSSAGRQQVVSRSSAGRQQVVSRSSAGRQQVVSRSSAGSQQACLALVWLYYLPCPRSLRF